MNEFSYTTQQAAIIFQVSGETIRTWAVEFDGHLSPIANPGNRKKRKFSEDDMKILALVQELKNSKATYQDIHLALNNGQRGKLEAPPPQEVDTLALANREQLQTQVKLLTAQLESLSSDVARVEEYKTQAIELQTRLQETQSQLERSQGKEDKLQEKIDQLNDELQQLSTKIGQEYARGFGEGIRFERDDSSK